MSFDLNFLGSTWTLFNTTLEQPWDGGSFTLDGDEIVIVNPGIPGEGRLRYDVNVEELTLEFVSQNWPPTDTGLSHEPYFREWYTSVPWTRTS